MFIYALKDGADLNGQDKYLNTPIHYATKAANLYIMRRLL
jgi:ankyrin repeat protein